MKLGDLLERHGDVEGAREAYQRGIDSGHPDHAPYAGRHLGDLLKEQGDVEGAKVAYQRAVDFGDSHEAPWTARRLGYLLERQGDVEGARAAYQRAIDSGHPRAAAEAVRDLGRLVEEHGDVGADGDIGEHQALRNSITALVERAAGAVAGPIEARLVEVYGQQWLSAVNERRSTEGRARGRGVDDPLFVVALLADDPAFEHWADDGWRDRARWLNAVADRARNREPVTLDEIAHAQQVTTEFLEAWGPPAPTGQEKPDYQQAGELLEELFQQGQLEQGDWAGAESTTRRWIETDPHKPVFYACLAQVLLQLENRAAEALELLETAESLGYHDIGRMTRALAFAGLKRFQEALAARLVG